MVAQKIAENDIIHPELLGRALRDIDQKSHLWNDFDKTATKGIL